MSKERRKHTPEFKREALNMVIDQHLSVAEVSRRLGISQTLLHKWTAQFAAQGEQAFRRHGLKNSPVNLSSLVLRCQRPTTLPHSTNEKQLLRTIELSRFSTMAADVILYDLVAGSLKPCPATLAAGRQHYLHVFSPQATTGCISSSLRVFSLVR